MKRLILSPNRLGKAACLRRYYYYAVLGRRARAIRGGADAGTCMHAGIASLVRGDGVADQEAVVQKARADLLMGPDDYRTAAYLCDALAQVRATVSPLAAEWQVLETEKHDIYPLGTVGDVPVFLEFRRDLVVRLNAEVFVVDWKTASRNETADVAARQNSGAFKAYVWHWNETHPNMLAAGLQPVRIIMRPPTRSGVAYDVVVDPPIRFSLAALTEWRDMTLRRAADLLSRNPNGPEDWPMSDTETGLCRNQWGCCDYLPVCTLPPSDRSLKLATDAFTDNES